MTDGNTHIITDKHGRRAFVDVAALDDASEQVLIRLEDGQAVMVERSLLQTRDDGELTLPLSFTDLQNAEAGTEDEIVIPIIDERVEVAKRDVEVPRFRITKSVSEREVLVDEPLVHEEVDVDRVLVNQMVSEPPPIRYEGDTMIVPILEEVIVVDVRLMVREELRITRRRETVRERQSVTLRKEDVDVTPSTAMDDESSDLT